MTQANTPRRPGDEARGDGPRGADGRVQRLEETVGFTEHAVEQMNQQMTAMLKQMEHLAKRLEAMERRLEVMTSGDGPDVEQE